MRYDQQVEVDRLISIAHLHALNAIAQPESERQSHLDVCRGFWKHYAAAFATDETQCDAFADALEHATRDLIAEMEQMSGVPGVSDVGAMVQPGAIALEELRPIFRKIIEQ